MLPEQLCKIILLHVSRAASAIPKQFLLSYVLNENYDRPGTLADVREFLTEAV